MRARGGRGASRHAEAAPPIVARVLRGGKLESSHRAAGAALDSEGYAVAGWGDATTPVFVRSAAKPFQALILLEAGGERAFRLGDDDIALTCASHGGEPRHVRVARRLLDRGGFRERDLVCGAHVPMHEASARALASRRVRPTALHNNCSGKHAGILLACRLLSLSPKGYWRPSHPIQRKILRRVSDLTGVPERVIDVAIDGCHLPVFRLPLAALALGYARLLAEDVEGESADRKSARRRIVRAMSRSPDMVAGRGRFTTQFLAAGRGRWIGKEGAEGVYAVGIAASRGRPRGLGLAFKIEDGSTRPRDAVTLALLEALGAVPREAGRRLARYRSPILRNVRGAVVGAIEAEAPPTSAR